MGKQKVFYHWGDLGDIVYGLPTIRALGGGELVLALSEERFAAMEPLLSAQPYITGVRRDPVGVMGAWGVVPADVTHDLNTYRLPEYGSLTWATLLEAQSWPLCVRVSSEPWLSVPGVQGLYNRALVARSARYHREDADWKSELEAIRWRYSEVLFVGTPREHQEFGRGLEYLPTSTCLDLATAIWHSKYFSGNQSMPLSIAIGLGVPHSIEIDPTVPNCTFRGRPEQREVARFAHRSSQAYPCSTSKRPLAAHAVFTPSHE